jgi:hypothetical protein
MDHDIVQEFKFGAMQSMSESFAFNIQVNTISDKVQLE